LWEITMKLHCNRSSAPGLGVRKVAVMALLAFAAFGLASCSTPKQFSYLDGYRWSRAEINTYDTLIVSVDGKSYPYNSAIRVDPGRHHIVFQTRPAAGFTYSPDKTLDIDIKPCLRYWFEAKRVNSLKQDFEPRVNYTERIVACGEARTAMGSGTGY
jgi:hypothetical protein